MVEKCPEIVLKFSKKLVLKFYFVLLWPLRLVFRHQELHTWYVINIFQIYRPTIDLHLDLKQKTKTKRSCNYTDGLVRMIATNMNGQLGLDVVAVSVGQCSVTSLYVECETSPPGLYVCGRQVCSKLVKRRSYLMLRYYIKHSTIPLATRHCRLIVNSRKWLCVSSFHRRYASFVAFHSLLACCIKLLLIQEATVKQT